MYEMGISFTLLTIKTEKTLKTLGEEQQQPTGQTLL